MCSKPRPSSVPGAGRVGSRRQWWQQAARGALGAAAWLQTTGAVAGAASAPDGAAPPPREGGPRILHVMSFDSPWRWTDGQLAGFRETLDEPQAQWQVFQMDVKRHASDAAKAERGRLARELVAQWRPDLVYLSDDDAVAQVARPLAGSALPIVFSGVNRALAEHGLAGAANVTGVLEREHISQTLNLLQAVAPPVRRLAVVSDLAGYWETVLERVRQRLTGDGDIALTRVLRVERYTDFQRGVLALPEVADAVLFLGIFNLAGADGVPVPYRDVQRWVVEHSRLPDASFWHDRVAHGNLVSVTVSELEQGRAAGRLARAILREGRPPASLPVQPTTQGRPTVSLARARQLGLPLRASLLLSSEVLRRFAWQEGGG